MRIRDARLNRIRQQMKPADGRAVRIVWINTETGEHTIDGVTMTAAEYDRRYPEKGLVIEWPKDGDL